MDSPTGKSLSDSSAGGTNFSKGYTHYVLGILTVVYVFNFIDRQIFAILAQSIKTDLGLSDLEIGALGIPGVVLALILRKTVKEPPRGYSEGRVPDGAKVPFTQVLSTMWSYRSFRHLAFGAGTQAFVGYAAIAWMPAFLQRTHGMSSGEVGTALGLIIGLFGGIGTFFGGRWADRLGRTDERWFMWLPAMAFLVAPPISRLCNFTSIANNRDVSLGIARSFVAGNGEIRLRGEPADRSRKRRRRLR